MTQEKRCSRTVNGTQCGATVTGDNLASVVLCKPCFNELHTKPWLKMRARDRKNQEFQPYGRSAK